MLKLRWRAIPRHRHLALNSLCFCLHAQWYCSGLTAVTSPPSAMLHKTVIATKTHLDSTASHCAGHWSPAERPRRHHMTSSISTVQGTHRPSEKRCFPARPAVPGVPLAPRQSGPPQEAASAMSQVLWQWPQVNKTCADRQPSE